MKKIADNRTYDVQELRKADYIKKTGMIVWLGSSKYWNSVYFNKKTGRLMVLVDSKHLEPLDKFNVREVGGI
jgi:hypothetical protein